VLCAHVKALSLQQVEDALLADDWAAGCLIWDYWDRHGVRDFKTEPWHWDTPPKPGARTTSGSRKAAMIMPVPPQPMCPKETRVSVSYGLGLSHDDQGRDIVRLKSSAVSHDVPYGDHFSVEENIEMVREGDGVLVTKSFSADFVKRTFLRSMIESSIKNSQKDTCEKLMIVLQSYAEDMSPVNVGSPTSCTPRPRSSNSGIFGMIDDDESSMEDAVSIGDDGFESAEEDPVISAALAGVDDDMDGSLVSALPSIVDFLGDLGDTISSIAANTWVKHNAIKNVDLRCEVWEVQRRTTMFHEDWRAPFLPHDGQKQARWVDTRFHKHPWLLTKTSVSAAAAVPPLEPPPAMREKGEWTINPDGPADKDGWQYSTDFHRTVSKWGAKSTIGLCRKRRWECSFVRQPCLPNPRIVKVQMWELQRRTTIFQSDWRAPFLPHDALRQRWRWVDLDFNIHPWSRSDPSTFSSAEKPPIQAPDGWEAEGWVVAEPTGTCDPARWPLGLYAVFHRLQPIRQSLGCYFDRDELPKAALGLHFYGTMPIETLSNPGSWHRALATDETIGDMPVLAVARWIPSASIGLVPRQMPALGCSLVIPRSSSAEGLSHHMQVQAGLAEVLVHNFWVQSNFVEHHLRLLRPGQEAEQPNSNREGDTESNLRCWLDVLLLFSFQIKIALVLKAAWPQMECGEVCQVEILNAATMLPPMFSCAAACWLVGPKAWWRSHAAIALLSGWFLMVPASTASHLYCAFNGQYLPKLERLDQACISIASVLAAWALSRSNLFTAFVGSICISLDLLMFAGPEELHHHVAWRTETLACVVLLYLSPMVWRRNTFDFSIIPICLCFLFGLAMAVWAPLGPRSHPLFHLALIPFSYYTSRSAMLFEKSHEEMRDFLITTKHEESDTDESTTLKAETSEGGDAEWELFESMEKP
ncbi:unnamed protein product, partial [Symbiodinium microadriaticum]